MLTILRTTRLAPVPTTVLLCLFAYGISAYAQSEFETELEQGVSWRLAEHRYNTLSDVRYEFDLSIPDSLDEKIKGKATIQFNWLDESQEPVVLDFLAPTQRVSELEVNGAKVQWRAVHDHLVIPSLTLDAGANKIELTFLAGDEALNRSEDFLYALFVPDRAHFSLPLFDQPNLKGRVTWQVSVPRQWQVVANGPLIETLPSGDRSHYSFDETEPMPSYLFAIAAGLFQKVTATINGRELAMYHRETDQDKVARNKDAIFELHGTALAWLEDYTQIDYPFKKFDFVLVPSFQYGGMEHPGSILYRSDSLMLDETATQTQILGRASLIAHETAHMWFGDLVTMNWFDDVWTKEVFANFMAAKIVNPSFPEINHDLRFLTAHHPTAYSVDRTLGANQIRQPLENLRYAGTLYGAIIYQKAPIVMRHLENRIGEEQLRAGLQEYLRSYAYGNATWPDLIQILDNATAQDLSAWSRVWVEEAGRPTISVIRQEGGQIEIRQRDPQGLGRLWPQSLKVLVGSADDNRLVPVELNGESIVIEGVGDSQFILPNGSGLEYGNFILDLKSQDYLIENLAKFEDPIARGAIWITLWDQVLARRLEPTRLLDAMLYEIPSEKNELILSRLLGYVSVVYWNLLSPETRDERSLVIEELLWAETISERSKSSRSAFYAAYRSMALSEEGKARLTRIWRGEEEVSGIPLSEADLIDLASALAIRAVPNAEAILAAQEAQIENPDRLARFRFLRDSLSQDVAVRDKFFDSLSLLQNRSREAWVGAALDNLHHPLRAQYSQRYIQDALELIEEIQVTGDIFFPTRWLTATLGGHSSLEAAQTVEDFLTQSETLSPRLRLKVLQAADTLFRSAAILHDYPERYLQ